MTKTSLIQIENLTKEYGSDWVVTPVIKSVSFSINHGSVRFRKINPDAHLGFFWTEPSDNGRKTNG